MANSTNLQVTVTRNRLAIQKLRNVSPKLKDVLRERFQTRIKEKRHFIFNKLRNGSSYSDLIEMFTHSSISKEFKDFYEKQIGNNSDEKEINEALTALKEMEEEMLAQEELMLAEHQKTLAYDDSMLTVDQLTMMCPLCPKGFMSVIANLDSSNLISCCNCNARIQTKVSLQEMETQISSCVSVHSKVCSSVPEFFVKPEQDSSALFILCSNCKYIYPFF